MKKRPWRDISKNKGAQSLLMNKNQQETPAKKSLEWKIRCEKEKYFPLGSILRMKVRRSFFPHPQPHSIRNLYADDCLTPPSPLFFHSLSNIHIHSDAIFSNIKSSSWMENWSEIYREEGGGWRLVQSVLASSKKHRSCSLCFWRCSHCLSI